MARADRRGLPPALERLGEVADEALYRAPTAQTLEEVGESKCVLHEEAPRLLRESRKRRLPDCHRWLERECEQTCTKRLIRIEKSVLEAVFFLELNEKLKRSPELGCVEVGGKRRERAGA